ncbi:MAG: hypothetical protein IKD11_01700 [Oscillospiraceae bacterium]|nr:hypothetical protein [Oscillospiraceae bacterium]
MRTDDTKKLNEEVRRVPKRYGKLRGFVTLVVVLAVVLAAVLVAAYWDLNSFDSFKRLLTYDKVAGEDVGRFSYSAERGNLYEMLGERLLIVSPTHITLLDTDGTQLCSESVKLVSPAIERGGKTAAVYGVGTQELYILGENGIVRDMSNQAEGTLLSVSLNSSDYMAVVSEKTGYKAAVTAYDPNGEAVFAFNSSARYIVDAAIERDCKSVSVAALGEKDGSFETLLTRYSLSDGAELSHCSLDNTLVYEVASLGSRVAALTDDRVAALGSDGSLTGAYYYAYPHLRAFSFGGDFAALALSRSRSGSAGKLVTVGAEGNQIASLELRKEVLDVSAAGKYLAVLYGDSLTVYTSDLQEYASLEDSNYAKRAIMREDGTVLLLGSAEGWLYVP